MSEGVPYHARDLEKIQYVPSLLELNLASPVGSSAGRGGNR